MHAITYIKAHFFKNTNAAIKLKNENPTAKNIKLANKLTHVKNTHKQFKKQVRHDAFVYQSNTLTGKTIDPLTASRHRNKVEFDGYGKIISVPTHLKKRDFNTLVENVIRPLHETPSKNNDSKIRTASECIIDMACEIKKCNFKGITRSSLENTLKELYLSGNISNATLNLFMMHVSQLPNNDSKTVARLHEIHKSMEGEFYITKHNDNYYGRVFDSTIAEMIVNAPSDEMNKVTESIKNFIINDFSKLSKHERIELLDELFFSMRKDPAPWRANIPEAQSFINDNTASNFLKMISAKTNLRHLLLTHLAVKYIVESPGLKKIKNTASALYTNVIMPQRDLHSMVSDNEESRRTGIKLSYQSQSKDANQGYKGVRPIDRYKLANGNLTEHNREALTSERPIAIGMSGSSNILNHLFLSLKNKDSGFNIDHARLLTAAYMTYSGGHSINEAYTVFGYKDREHFRPVNYSTLRKQDEYTKKIIDDSYDKLIEEAIRLN